MKRKSFKTVSGYLRFMDLEIHSKNFEEELAERTPIPDDEAVRFVLNKLFQQLGIAGRINDDEKPREGVKRLLYSLPPTDSTKAKQLNDCVRWLDNRVRVASVNMTTINHVK